MLVIPILDVYSQTLNVTLDGQVCRLTLYQKSTGFFCDLYVKDVLLSGGMICQDRNRLVRDLYIGFIGDLMFFDTQGYSDPSSPGLGTRYCLGYFTQDELVEYEAG